MEKSILCLISFGYRGPDDEGKGVQNYKGGGYSIWGILGDQYSSIEGTSKSQKDIQTTKPIVLCFLKNPLVLIVSFDEHFQLPSSQTIYPVSFFQRYLQNHEAQTTGASLIFL